jgi:hypothetical protein
MVMDQAIKAIAAVLNSPGGGKRRTFWRDASASTARASVAARRMI